MSLTTGYIVVKRNLFSWEAKRTSTGGGALLLWEALPALNSWKKQCVWGDRLVFHLLTELTVQIKR